MSMPVQILEAAFGSNVNVDPGSWTDITLWDRSAKTARGRQHFLSRFDAGTLNVQLDNRDRRFDPTNTSSPYNPNLVPMTPVRLRASWNLLTKNQASLETNTTGWAALTNCAIAQSSAQAADGANSLRLTSVASGNMDATTLTGTSGIACVVGQQYTAMAYFRSAVSARSVLVAIAWYNAAGTFLSESAGTSVGDTTSGFTQATVTATAPANAAFAAVRVRVLATGAASEVHYVDKIGLFPAPSITVWSAGSGGADAYPVFRGFVESWEQNWIDQLTTEVPLKVVDGFKYLSYANLPASAWATTVAADAPLIWWRLGEQSGAATVTDSSGNGRGGSAYGQLVSATGLVANDADGAISFSGATGAFLQLTSLSITDYTIIIIFSTTQTPGSQGATLVTFMNANNDGFPRIWLDSTGHINADVGSGLTTARTYNDGKTHVLMFTYNDSVQTGTLYIDGANVGSAFPTAQISFPRQFLVAMGPQHSGNAGGAPVNFFNGILDEVILVGANLGAKVAAYYSAATTPWSGDASGTRGGRILDLISWPSTLRAIDAGNSTFGSATLGTTVSALTYLQSCENSEFGKLFMSKDGKVTFFQRWRPITSPANASKATFADDGSGYPYELAGVTKLTLDDADVYNAAAVQRAGGALQSAKDATSQARYGVRNTPNDSGLLNASDGEMLDRANWEVTHFKNPIARLPAISIDLNADPGNLFPLVLGLEIGDRITVKRTPAGGGSTFTQDAIIERIEHTIGVDSWHTVLSLFAAETSQYLVLDDAVLGKLDNGILIGY